MADDADLAGDVIDGALQASLARVRLQMSEEPVEFHKECKNCGEPTEGTKFCSKSCCDDWTYFEARRKAQGQKH
jgi:coproporphyrinogen III oxidase